MKFNNLQKLKYIWCHIHVALITQPCTTQIGTAGNIKT